MRIIGGAWRGRRVTFVGRPGLRPTSDRVKETLFNWLGERIVGARCLDLFAGSGSLGFEAASRGAGRVVMVDNDAQVVAQLRQVAERLNAVAVTVARKDAFKWLDSSQEEFDLVFLDPPFEAGVLESACAALSRGALVPHDSLVYLECRAVPRQSSRPTLPPDWRVRKASAAGQVRYYLASPGSASGLPAVSIEDG